MATDELVVVEAPHTNSGRRRRKNRFIKQGYHKSERDDARRVAARTFLSGIVLDSHLQQQEQQILESTSQFESSSHGQIFQERSGSLRFTPTRPLSSMSRQSNALQLMDESSNTEFGLLGDRKLYELGIALESLPQFHYYSPSKAALSKSLERSSSSPMYPLSLVMDSSSPEKKLVNQLVKMQSIEDASSVVYVGNMHKLYHQHHRPGSLNFSDSRLVLASGNGVPFALSSILDYRNSEGKIKLDHPPRTRVRVNSMSLHLDLDVELGTSNTEVSLSSLLVSLWVVQSSDSTQHDSHEHTPILIRRQSTKRGGASSGDIEKKNMTLKFKNAFHMNPHSLEASRSHGSGYPWQSFRDFHSVEHVLLNYHPHCLDNYDYFVGHNRTTFTPLGYMVSIIQYERSSDSKKGINDKFNDIFPYIKISLSKLRSIKREMRRVALECDVDLAAVAYAYVYFEKLVLMGKINKANRKIVGGCCLVLAAKFFTDMKKPEILALVEKITDEFHVSNKELLLYEFPVLAALQFALLTPNYQVQAHFKRLRELGQH